MNADALFLLLGLVFALSAALLTWFAIDLGTTTLTRYRETFTERTRFQAQEFFLFIDPRKVFVANMAAMFLVALVVWLVSSSSLLGLAAGAAMGLLPRLLYRSMRLRRFRRFEEQLPEALMTIAGGLRAGAGLGSTLQQVVQQAQAPLSQEFSLMLREQRLGVTLQTSLNNLNRRIPTQATTLTVSAMRIASETGGGLAETLERTAQTVRARLQMEGKIGALTSQGKLQAWVVGMLPLVLLLVLNKMEPEAMQLLWSTRIGWAVLASLALLEFMGIYVIRRIVAIDV